MKKKCFTNAGLIVQTRLFPSQPLVGEELNEVPCLQDGYVTVENGKIIEVGAMSDFHPDEDTLIEDLQGGWIFPGYIDSHTHTVFPYYRSDEFEKRLSGVSYQQIAAEGGGILNTARRLANISEDDLFHMAKERINDMIEQGTVALEIKSGYGLTMDSELKMLRVIKQLRSHFPIVIKSTFLGAHAIPAEFKKDREGYLKLLLDDILPVIAEEQLADYIDVFCETGYFTAEESLRIMNAGEKFGLKSKIHTNQFTSIGGIQAAISAGALSVDHLEIMTPADIIDLAGSDTMACLLPIAPFFLNDPYPPARKMIDEGVKIALASDFNPGSAPSYDMALVQSLACIKCGMLPKEALNAVTINAAFALEVENHLGCITPGAGAHFFITPPLKTLADIPYRICSEFVRQVIIHGEEWQRM